MVDAAAIAEAVTRPTMRFVEVRQPEQSARQALHRVRDRYMSQRTGLINQVRGFLLEFGIAGRGVGRARAEHHRQAHQGCPSAADEDAGGVRLQQSAAGPGHQNP